MNREKIKAIYGENWDIIAKEIKVNAGWKCQVKGCKNEITKKNKLTVHHIDGCPLHSERSNLEAACGICHLTEQRALQPCIMLMKYKPGMSQTEINALCHKCSRNRREHTIRNVKPCNKDNIGKVYLSQNVPDIDKIV